MADWLDVDEQSGRGIVGNVELEAPRRGDPLVMPEVPLLINPSDISLCAAAGN